MQWNYEINCKTCGALTLANYKAEKCPKCKSKLIEARTIDKNDLESIMEIFEIDDIQESEVK